MQCDSEDLSGKLHYSWSELNGPKGESICFVTLHRELRSAEGLQVSRENGGLVGKVRRCRKTGKVTELSKAGSQGAKPSKGGRGGWEGW